ncbi:DUF4880 domain-containing protein [Pseudomonas sp. X10]
MNATDDQERLIEQATHWIVLLRSGSASEADHQAFQTWRAQDPRHEQLCQRLETTLSVFQVPKAQGIGGAVLQRTLAAPSGRRKFIQGALLGAGVALGAGWGLNNPLLAPMQLGADISTGTGQRQRIALQDGSQLTMNAESAADVRFDDQWRLLKWRGGEGLIEIAGDSRPFRVQTRAGSISAQVSRLLLHERGASCRVSALSAELELINQQGDGLLLQAGQSVTFDRFRFGAVQALSSTEGAWVDGLLEVRDSPLAEVIDALRPYRRGVLRVDPDIAGLRVSGLFRLDDSDIVLEALSRTLPIRVTRHSDYWVMLSPA